jgi:hypothetical protein
MPPTRRYVGSFTLYLAPPQERQSIIANLPDKREITAFCHLARKQAEPSSPSRRKGTIHGYGLLD